MPLNRIRKADLDDNDIIDSYELASDGHSENSIYLDITVVSTVSSTKTVTVNLAADSEGILYSYDHPVQPNDIVWLHGTLSGGAADGYYTVDTIVDDTSFTVVETIPDSTDGYAQFRYQAGATNIGVDSRSLAYSNSNVLQTVLEDLDTYLPTLSILGDVTGTLSASTVSKIHGSPVTTIGAADTVLGTTDGTNITYFKVTNAQIDAAAAIVVSKLADAAGLSVLGRSANSTGAHADIVGTNNQVLRISGSVLGFGAVDLSTAQVTGVLPDANQAAQTLGGDLSGTTAAATLIKINGSPVTTIGSANTVLGTTDGTNITYFQVADAQISSSAAIAVSKLANATALSVLGRSANSSGAHADIAGTNNQVLRISGSVLGFGAVDLSTAQVTGVLPTGNQAAQILGGDLSGTTAAATVIKINGSPVTTIGPTNTVLGTGDGTNVTYFKILDGYVATNANIAVSKLAAGTDGYYLNTTSGTPTWASVPTDSLLGRDTAGTGALENITLDTTLEFTGSQVIRRAALTGDVSASAGSNTTAIGANKVLDTMIRQGVALSVIGRSANSTGNVADISGANNQVLRISGSVLGFGTLDLATMTTASADVSINSHKLTSVTDPSNPQDAATKHYVDGYGYGTLTIAGDVTGTLAATTVVKLQNRTLSSSAPTDGYVLTWNNGTSTWVTTGHSIDTGSTSNYLTFGGPTIPTTGLIRLPYKSQASGGIIAITAVQDDGATFADIIDWNAVAANVISIGNSPGGVDKNAEIRLRTPKATVYVAGTQVFEVNSTIADFKSLSAQFGNANLATDGYLRFSNSSTAIISQRNAANGANIHLLGGDGNNNVLVGDTAQGNDVALRVATGKTIRLSVNNVDEYTFTSSVMDFTNNAAQWGTNPATTGNIRLPASAGDQIVFRNNGNSANLQGMFSGTDDVLYMGDPTNGAGINIRTKAAGFMNLIFNATPEYQFNSSRADFTDNIIKMGALGTVATDGYINFPQNPGKIISAENFDATGTINIMTLQGTNTFSDLIIGDSGAKGNSTIYFEAKTQAVVQVNGVNEFIFNASSLNFGDNVGLFGTNPSSDGYLRFQNNCHVLSGRVAANNANSLLLGWSSSNDITIGDNSANTNDIYLAPNNTIHLYAAGAEQYSFNSTTADFKSNNLIGVQRLDLGSTPASDTVAEINLSGGAHDLVAVKNHASTGYAILFRYDAFVNDMFYVGSTSSDAFKITDMRFGVGTGGTYTYEVNSAAEYTYTSTTADFKDNILQFGTNPAAAGTIRFPQSSTIYARNNANSGDLPLIRMGAVTDTIVIGGGTEGVLGLQLETTSGSTKIRIAAADEYTFSNSTADFKDNVLQFGTNPSASGTIRLANGGAGVVGISSRNNANSGDLGLIASASDDAIYVSDSSSAALYLRSGADVRFRPTGSGSDTLRVTSTFMNMLATTIRMGNAGTQATDGYINFTQNAGQLIRCRNYDDTGTIALLQIGGNNTFSDLRLGDDSAKGVNSLYYQSKAQHLHYINGTNITLVNSAGLTLFSGSNASSSGVINLPKNVGMYARNSNNTADILLIGTNNSSAVLVGDANSGGITYNTATGNLHLFQHGGTTKYQLGNGSSDWGFNTMASMGNIIDAKQGSNLTDADVTKNVSDGYVFVLPAGTLTATRNFTGGATGASNGHVMTIKRYDVSANTYVIKNNGGTTLFTMPASTKYWCSIWRNPLSGTDWLLFQHGGLQ